MTAEGGSTLSSISKLKKMKAWQACNSTTVIKNSNKEQDSKWMLSTNRPQTLSFKIYSNSRKKIPWLIKSLSKRVNESLYKIVNERVQTLSTVFRSANKYFKKLTHVSKHHWTNYSTYIIILLQATATEPIQNTRT